MIFSSVLRGKDSDDEDGERRWEVAWMRLCVPFPGAVGAHQGHAAVQVDAEVHPFVQNLAPRVACRGRKGNVSRGSRKKI
jgi:hypothetical protein